MNVLNHVTVFQRVKGQVSVCCPHLPLDGQFDGEGDEVGEELLQPVGSDPANTGKGQTQSGAVHTVEARDLLSVSLQMQTELVEVQVAVRRVRRHLPFATI